MDEEQEILAQTVIEDDGSSRAKNAASDGSEKIESESALALSEKLKAEKKQRDKKIRKLLIILGVIAVFTYIVWWLFKPFKAPENYGICRTFLEFVVPYPHTIYVSEVNTLSTGAMRLWYTHTDAFGEFRMEEFRCKIKQDAATGQKRLDSVQIGEKVFVDEEVVKHWNMALPYFAMNPVVYNYPLPLSDSLANLHFEFDNFRKVVLSP